MFMLKLLGGNQTVAAAKSEARPVVDSTPIYTHQHARWIGSNSVIAFTENFFHASSGGVFVENQTCIVKSTNENSMLIRKEKGDGQVVFEILLNELLGKIKLYKNLENIFSGVRYEARENFRTKDGTSIKKGDIIVIDQYYKNEKGERNVVVYLERARNSNRTWDQSKEIRLQDISYMKKLYVLWRGDIVECSQHDGNYQYGVVTSSYPLAIKLCTEYHDNTISPRFYKYVRSLTEDVQNQQRAIMNAVLSPETPVVIQQVPPSFTAVSIQVPPVQPAEFQSQSQREPIQTQSQSQAQSQPVLVPPPLPAEFQSQSQQEPIQTQSQPALVPPPPPAGIQSQSHQEPIQTQPETQATRAHRSLLDAICQGVKLSKVEERSFQRKQTFPPLTDEEKKIAEMRKKLQGGLHGIRKNMHLSPEMETETSGVWDDDEESDS